MRHRKSNRLLRVRTAVILAFAEVLMLLGGVTGCGNTSGEVPELIEPASAIESYRPVSKRIIGNINYVNGVVVAKEYPVFAEKSTKLSEIYVGVGDYVKAGDIVAMSSVTEKEDEIKNLQAEIASLIRLRSKTKNVSDATITKLGFEKKIEEYLSNTDGINLKTKDILIEQENQRYNLAVIDNQVSELRASLSKLQEEAADNTFVATKTGRVTFVKDMSKTNVVAPFENIVVISDYDDLYVEVPSIEYTKYKYAEYKGKWTYVNGKMVDISERKYTNEEISYAESLKKSPPMSFDINGITLTLGTDIILCFMEDSNIPKLTVGNDSISYDNGEYYVYVKGKDGTNEKRILELGVSDGLYTEVESGIEEGELVYYQNTAMIPNNYQEAEAVIGSYTEDMSSNIISYAYPYYDIYTAEIGGNYIKLRDVGNATGGDALFSVESSVGKAQLGEIRDNIEDLDNERSKSSREYDFNKRALEEEIRGAEMIGPEGVATDTDAIRENLYRAERKECELNILNYEEDYAQKEYVANKAAEEAKLEEMKIGTTMVDGASDYVVHSSGPGRITSLQYDNNRTIEKDSYVLTEELRSDDGDKTRLHVLMGTQKPVASAKIGGKVTLKKEDYSWTGTCIGVNGKGDRYMLTTKDGNPCATYSAPFSKNVVYQFYVEMDAELSETDLMQSEMSFNACEMHDIVVIPGSALKTEIAALSKAERYYVWKVENGDIVKEYVDVYNPHCATSVKYILNGVEPGDTVLK